MGNTTCTHGWEQEANNTFISQHKLFLINIELVSWATTIRYEDIDQPNSYTMHAACSYIIWDESKPRRVQVPIKAVCP